MSVNRARSLEYRAAESQKFWTITLEGKKHTVRFDRIGTNGQTRTKEFDSSDDAQKSLDKMTTMAIPTTSTAMRAAASSPSR